MHAFALIVSWNLAVITPSGSRCANGSVGYDNKRTLTSYNTTFVASPGVTHPSLVLVEVQEQRRILFQLTQGERMFQNDDSATLSHFVAEPVHRCESKTNFIFQVSILNFLNFSIGPISKQTVKETYLCILPILFATFFLSTTFLPTSTSARSMSLMP